MRKFKVIVSFTLAGFIILSGWSAYRRAKRYLPEFREPMVNAGVAGSKRTASPNQPTSSRHIMAAAFESRRLPEPLPIPTGDPDKTAEELAKKIAARDEQSTAALMAALEMAGFGIRNPGGQLIVQPSGASQGMAFDIFSVSAMAKLFNDGWQISLADLSVILSKAIPEYQKLPLSELLADGIVKTTNGDQPLRFWARLIVELGKQSPAHYDFAGGKLDPATVQLDSVQTSLILTRLYGDMMGHVKPAAAAAVRPSAQRNDRAVFLRPAVFHPTRELRLLPTAAQDGGSDSPCDLGDIGDNIMDLNAIIKTTEWEKLLDFEKQEGIGGKVGGANAVLSILRVIWVYANMDVTVTMDAPMLIRTYDLDPGETRTLTAHVWFDIDKSAITNCLRPLLHREGLDFGSLPNGGAAEGVGVAWRLTEGGAPLPGQFHNDPAGLLEATHNALVYFDNGAGSEGSTWNKETDEKGDTTIKVTGNPQPIDLTHKKRWPVTKEMAIAVDVKYKNASKANKMMGELLDVLGPGLGIGSGDLLGGFAGAITETIFRMHWNINDVFTFPVKDWTAGDVWIGTIKAAEKYEPNFPPNIINQPAYHSQSTRTEKLEATEVITLDGQTTPDGLAQLAILTGSYSHTIRTDSSAQRQDDCHRASNIVTYTDESHFGSSEEMTKTTYHVVVVSSSFTDPAAGKLIYQIRTSYSPGDDATGNGIATRSGSDTKTGCEESQTTSSGLPTTIITVNWPSLPSLSAVADPKHPDVLVGHQDTTGDYSQQIEWNLHRPR
jgi:hypothetical protein